MKTKEAFSFTFSVNWGRLSAIREVVPRWCIDQGGFRSPDVFIIHPSLWSSPSIVAKAIIILSWGMIIVYTCNTHNQSSCFIKHFSSYYVSTPLLTQYTETRAKSRPKLNPIHEHRDISAWYVHGIQHLTYIGGSLNSDDTTKSPFSPITHPLDHFYYWLHPDILTQVRLIKFKMGFHILCHHRRIVTMTTIIGIKIILGNKS